MNSVLFFLGTLFTLGQCGGTPTAPPPPPPREGPKCHNVWIQGTCDSAYATRAWYDVYLPSDTMFKKATNEAECTQACQVRANTYGYGCCQWGDFWGEESYTKCRMAIGKPFAKPGPNPDSLKQMVSNNKVSHCSECESDSYRMAYPQNCNGKKTKATVDGFRGASGALAFTQSISQVDDIEYVFAAVGLAFVLYGGYNMVKKLM